ncbi:MAG TPA: DUF1499 domain-containing protein [Longimicrobium sp.]|nr:DUF1499 domain-containing protein [Longimicrobium sp.]
MSNVGIDRYPRRGNPAAWVALLVGVAAAGMLALTGPGVRFGWWHHRVSFDLMKYAAYVGIAAIVLALIAMLVGRRRGLLVAVLALLLGGTAFFLPWKWRQGAKGFPPIHDITTDTGNPPPFVAIAPLRKDATNKTEYEGDSIAAIQRQHYPDIRPLMMAMPRDSAFSLAVRAAREMGWELVDQDRASGRIEATARTKWFGFKDDVVVRVMPGSGITRVDVRSVSRVGRGDVGENAKRIREYLRRLKAMDPAPVQAG